MAVNIEKYREILGELGEGVRLVAVSKTKPVEDIRALYDLGQRDFGENYVQELVDKYPRLPQDIRWHFIGHLQSNKVRSIAPFVYLIHGVDSPRLLREIGKQGARCGRTIDCLLQVHIAAEETKFGLDAQELSELMAELSASASSPIPLSSTPSSLNLSDPAPPSDPAAPDAYKNIRIRGLMGMASNTDDPEKVRSEFHGLRPLFDQYFGPGAHTPGALQPTPHPTHGPADSAPILSMGMSGDYKIAIAEGSNTVRIGSLLFGIRSLPIKP